ncbi:hypothetical protein C2G38_2035910 [Gigaspora rosea]|uniref:Uncharacterized protein n=1 Tax=Gigaspora rosea TaxID=44941 RepID=A0A397VB09_9GLOM|nr:hypothetical protein C2G38_2035910 [Gigaspora rosea]CAG8476747.1 11821_t:CDS:1 [Gigaspora rosea]
MIGIEITNQKHLSDIVRSVRNQIIRCTEKIAQISGLDEQNLKVYNMLSGKIEVLDKKLDDYYSKYNSLRKIVKRLKREVGTQKNELEDLDECVDRNTVVDLIHKILPTLINKKGKSSSYSSDSSDSSKEFDSVEIVRERKADPYKQQRKARLRKFRQLAVYHFLKDLN